MNKQEQNIREFISRYTGATTHKNGAIYIINTQKEYENIDTKLQLLGCTEDGDGDLEYKHDWVLLKSTEKHDPGYGYLMQLVN